jgi:hypothetical protein
MANPGPSSRTQTNFNSGEWSPLLHDRIDFDKFFAAARIQENNFVYPYGGFERRAGTQYISESKSNTKVFLAPFIFSTTTAYIIEFGNNYMRFYSSGAQILSGSLPLEVVTPWTTAQLFELQFVQDDDLMYFAHPDVPRQKLTRTSATSFTLAEVEDITPPLLDENDTDETLTSSVTAIGASGTLTSSVAKFDALHVGSYWQLKHKRDANFVERTLTAGNSGNLVVEGDWRFEVTIGTDETIDAQVEQLSIDGVTWEVLYRVKGEFPEQSLIIKSGTQKTDTTMRVVINSVTDSAAGPITSRAYLENTDAFSIGLVKVTGYTSPTIVSIDVIETLFATTATPYWSEGAFSDFRGHPSAVCIYESRLWYGDGQTYYGSKIDDYEDFPVGTLDTDRIKYKLGGLTQNAIKWMVGQEDLLIGTSGEEFRISTGDSYQPLTPSTIPRQRSQSNKGSDNIQSHIVGETIMFVQRGGRKLREFSYSFENNKYKSPDLTILSEHITSGGIDQLAYQSDPYSNLYAVTGDGNLVGFAYEREQDLAGWYRYVTDGLFESVAVIPGPDGDEVWVSVNRTINSVTKRYIERINPNVWVNQESAFYVDSGISYNGSATSIFSGLDHLIGKTVQVLGDGAVIGEYVVDGAGQIDISSQEAAIAQIGLKFTSTYKPMKFDIDNLRGNSQGQFKQLHEVEIQCLNSMGFKVFDEAGKEINIKWRDMSDNTDTAIPFFSGPKSAKVEGNPGPDPFFTIVQEDPLPMTITSVTARYEITEPI